MEMPKVKIVITEKDVKIEGKGVALMLGVESLVRKLHEEGELTERQINTAVKTGLVQRKDVLKLALEELREILQDVQENNTNDEEGNVEDEGVEECSDFKIIIDKEHTEWEGEENAVLAGLGAFVGHLRENGVPKEKIEYVVKIGMEED